MSWIFGCIDHSSSPPERNSFETIHGAALYTTTQSPLYIATGGITETCHHSSNQEKKSGWIVVGNGIGQDGTRHSFLSNEQWEKIFSRDKPQPILETLDGHFVAIRWHNGIVECFTDQLGMRTLHLCRKDNRVFFSTRLDWIAQASNNTEINFAAFGSRWLTFNQHSFDSLVSGITRLGSNAYARVTGTSLSTTTKPWLPGELSPGELDYTSTISHLLAPLTDEKISLGLTGGMDSRHLLALLFTHLSDKFSAHTFGPALDPDVSTAISIAHDEHIEHHVFNKALPTSGELLTMLRSYSREGCVIEPVSAAVRSQYYPALAKEGMMSVDGTFGEMLRRSYLNRLLLYGKHALRSGNIKKIIPFFYFHRAEIFTRDVTETMQCGLLNEFEQVWGEMPHDAGLDENFIDLFCARTRVPNFGGTEQARLDSIVHSYTPFTQPSFLRFVFSLPIAARREARFFRRTIRDLRPSLARYPFVKNGASYPFGSSLVSSWLITRAKAKFGIEYKEQIVLQLLATLKEFILDLAHSAPGSFAAYDSKALVRLVETFYATGATDHRLATQIDWWLSFELWRESLVD